MSGRLVLLCGTSFSGKSTSARALADALPGRLVALDAINEERGLHGGNGIPLEEWAHTNRLARTRVAAALTDGDTVVLDDTSSPRFLRDGWRDLADQQDAAFALVFVDAARTTTLARWAANRATGTRGDVSDAVMREHLDTFEPPGNDEPHLRLAADDRDLDLTQVVADVRRALAG